MRFISCLIIVALFVMVSGAGAQNDLPWPVWPDSSRHFLSALYGVWIINPGDPPFMHSGIDIAVASGTPVYAIESGWVKTVTSRGGGYSSWRVVIGDSSGTDTCDAWMYAHIHEMSIPYNVMPGDYVEAGTYIGDVVDWGLPTIIEHLHLSKIRYCGTAQQWADGQDDWVFIANPLDHMTIDNDEDIPVLENARDDHLLAFCQNESDVYFDPGAPVSGDVDIICRAYDYHNFYAWKLVPYSIEYRIEGDSSVPWTMAACFTGVTGTYAQMADYTYTVYQDDATCHTWFDGNIDQVYYINLTNSDGDTLVEPSDKALCWETINFPNGDYWVYVRARDKSGHEIVDSMIIEVANIFEISGTANLNGGDPVPEGTIVTLLTDGRADTTDTSGSYSFASVPNGVHTLSFSRSVYATLDTTITINHNMDISVTLELGHYSCGDANGDGDANVGDAVFEISYVFKGGPPPDPPRLGDANCDGQTNIGDAVYLIAYVFKSGPPPCTECLD